MTYMDGPPSHRGLRRPVRRRPNPGKAPRDNTTRQLILKVAKAYPKFTAQEIKAILAHDHKRDVPVDEIIGALNGL